MYRLRGRFSAWGPNDLVHQFIGDHAALHLGYDLVEGIDVCRKDCGHCVSREALNRHDHRDKNEDVDKGEGDCLVKRAFKEG